MSLSWSDRHKPREYSAPPDLQVITGGTQDTQYGLAALASECETVAEAIPGTRNDGLNRAWYRMGRLVSGGQLTAATARQHLANAARQSGLPQHEIDGVLRDGASSALRAGQQAPRQPEPLADNFTITETSIDQITGEITEKPVDFWQARPILAHLRQFAYARMCSPWAVLGVVMLRALAIVPPHVVLPAIIGGPGSLNLFCALVGPSGVGKGAAEAAAVDAVRMPTSIYTATVGSGEGIAHQYAHREKKEIIYDRQAVLFTVSEVDTLTALGNRQGSTLLSQLRSAFSGERLGFGYADALKRIPIERHEYRLGMTVGVQPEKAGPLLDDADGGTPQRFIWLPATDQHINPDPPEEPEPWRIAPTNWRETTGRRGGYNIFAIPPEVADHIRQQHAARARGEGDALDGHALFAREKVAAALAVLDQRPYVNEDDWQLSGVVMAMSDITRQRVRHVLSEIYERSEQARSQSAARRAVATDEAVTDATVQRVCRNVLRHAKTAGSDGIGWTRLRDKLASRDREHFEDAIERLIEAGQIAVDEQPDGRSPDGFIRTVRGVS